MTKVFNNLSYPPTLNIFFTSSVLRPFMDVELSLSALQWLQRRDLEQLLCDGVSPGHRHPQRPLPEHGEDGSRGGMNFLFVVWRLHHLIFLLCSRWNELRGLTVVEQSQWQKKNLQSYLNHSSVLVEMSWFFKSRCVCVCTLYPRRIVLIA